MATTLFSAPILNTTNNALETFQGFNDKQISPAATDADKQAAGFAFGGALVAAGDVVLKLPLLGKIGGAFARVGATPCSLMQQTPRTQQVGAAPTSMPVPVLMWCR